MNGQKLARTGCRRRKPRLAGGPSGFAVGLARALLLCSALAVPATADDFGVTVAGDSLAIQVRSSLGAAVLPDFLRERLDRGIPATVGIQADLWRARSGWFDERVAQTIRHYRLNRDAWTGAYVLDGPEGSVTADSLDFLLQGMASRPLILPLSREVARAGLVAWVEVTAVTTPLSVEDLGEVEEWITGEIGRRGGSIFGIPGGILRLARDLTGLGDRRSTGRSPTFEASLIAGDFIWIRTNFDGP